MPHFIIEYTNNIKDKMSIDDLLTKVNSTLISFSSIFPVGGIRSRAIELEHYRIADGQEDDAFVHAILKIGAGRTDEQKREVCDALFSVIRTHFSALYEKSYLALSMELIEFNEFGTYKQNNIHSRFAAPSN